MTGKRAERLQVMLTIDEVRKVEEWRFENRMPSRSAAVRALMNLGLHAKAPRVDESAMLEGAVSSRDVGVVDNGSFLASKAGPNGPRILVMAAEYLVGQGIRRLLEEAGLLVVGPAASPEDARSLANNAAPAAAVIDAAAGGEAAATTADHMAAHGIPFLFLTAGGAHAALPERHRSAPVENREEAGAALAARVSGLLG